MMRIVGQAAADLVEHHRDLPPGEVGAEAEVRAAGAEADLCGCSGRRTSKRYGSVEHPLVAVGRGVPQHDLVAGLQLRRRRCAVSSVAVRRKWITGVAQRTISSTAVLRAPREVAEPELALVGMLGERLHPVADGVARRLVAGDDEEDEERAELLRGELLAVDLGVHHRRREVVGRVGAAVLAERLGVGEHPQRTRPSGPRSMPPYSGSPTPRIDVGPGEDLLLVGGGDAHHLADDLQRQRGGDLLDEVALAVREAARAGRRRSRPPCP